MKSKLLILLLIQSITIVMYSQDFINCSKSYLISKLEANGFEANPKAVHYFKDSANQVIAVYNEFRYSRIEYHITENKCDSISCTSSCDQCFDQTLNSILSNKKRKWRKTKANEFVSTKKPTQFKTGKEGERLVSVLKLVITSSKTTGKLSFLIYNQWINETKFKAFKKIKKYKGIIKSYS